MSSPAWHAEAKRLREEGLSYREIGELFGVTPSAAAKACNRERYRELNRQWNAQPERKAAKRRWAQENPGTCEVCGVRTQRKSHSRCFEHHIVREQRRVRAEWIVARWAEGWTGRQIAEALGWSPDHLGVEIDRLRKEGYDLPYRRSPEQLARMRKSSQRRWQKAA